MSGGRRHRCRGACRARSCSRPAAAGYRVCAVARGAPGRDPLVARVCGACHRCPTRGQRPGLRRRARRAPAKRSLRRADPRKRRLAERVSEHRERLEPGPGSACRRARPCAGASTSGAAGGGRGRRPRCAARAEAAPASRRRGAAAAELGFPVVLKPAQSFRPVNGGLSSKASWSRRTRSARAAVPAMPRLHRPALRARQFLSCTGVFAEGRLLAPRPHAWLGSGLPPQECTRSPRRWPLRPGLTDRCASCSARSAGKGSSSSSCSSWPAGGWPVIDLNPRVFASITLDDYAGANLAAVWCDWLLGRNRTRSRWSRSRPGGTAGRRATSATSRGSSGTVGSGRRLPCCFLTAG